MGNTKGSFTASMGFKKFLPGAANHGLSYHTSVSSGLRGATAYHSRKNYLKSVGVQCCPMSNIFPKYKPLRTVDFGPQERTSQ